MVRESTATLARERAQLADNTRWQRKPDTFDSVEDALRETARFYRKNLWRDADSYVEVWLEKDALAGVIYPATSMYDVPLMVARGYASLSFLYNAAEYINDLDVPTFIYHCGDFDPSGVNAGEKIEETLHELAPDADITFERIAVTPEQITAWALPTRPTKPSDTRAKSFGAISVELDAIEPNRLRSLVQETIELHLPADQLAVLKAAEESECDRRTSGDVMPPEGAEDSAMEYYSNAAIEKSCDTPIHWLATNPTGGMVDEGERA